MPRQPRTVSLALVASGLAISLPALASWGQMKFTLDTFAMITCALLALPFALADWIGSKLPSVRPWLRK